MGESVGAVVVLCGGLRCRIEGFEDAFAALGALAPWLGAMAARRAAGAAGMGGAPCGAPAWAQALARDGGIVVRPTLGLAIGSTADGAGSAGGRARQADPAPAPAACAVDAGGRGAPGHTDDAMQEPPVGHASNTVDEVAHHRGGADPGPGAMAPSGERDGSGRGLAAESPDLPRPDECGGSAESTPLEPGPAIAVALILAGLGPDQAGNVLAAQAGPARPASRPAPPSSVVPSPVVPSRDGGRAAIQVVLGGSSGLPRGGMPSQPEATGGWGLGVLPSAASPDAAVDPAIGAVRGRDDAPGAPAPSPAPHDMPAAEPPTGAAPGGAPDRTVVRLAEAAGARLDCPDAARRRLSMEHLRHAAQAIRADAEAARPGAAEWGTDRSGRDGSSLDPDGRAPPSVRPRRPVREGTGAPSSLEPGGAAPGRHPMPVLLLGHSQRVEPPTTAVALTMDPVRPRRPGTKPIARDV